MVALYFFTSGFVGLHSNQKSRKETRKKKEKELPMGIDDLRVALSAHVDAMRAVSKSLFRERELQESSVNLAMMRALRLKDEVEEHKESLDNLSTVLNGIQAVQTICSENMRKVSSVHEKALYK